MQVGDAGIINTTLNLIDSEDEWIEESSLKKFFLLDILLILAHAALLNVLAWYSAQHPFVYISLLYALAGINMIWLGMKVKSFNDVFERISNEGLKARVSEARNAMLNWLIINGVYSSTMSALMFFLFENDPSLFWKLATAATIIRSFIDLGVCYSYYSNVLTGKFTRKRLTQ